MAKHNEIGELGENIAVSFIENKGYTVIERNYRRKWGEIDIVARKSGVTHFIEVKTISRLSSKAFASEDESRQNISREKADSCRPEDNMHEKKIERLHRAIQSYLGDAVNVNDWQLDLVTVELFIKDKKAECRMIENVL